jgi:membrane-associated phospholipid phosphatase
LDVQLRRAGPLTRRIAIVIAVVALAVLSVAVAVDGGALAGEVAYIRSWQRLGTPVPEFAEFVRLTTSTEAALIAGALPAVWLVRRHGRHGLAAVAICVGSMLVVQPGSKEIVDRDRPVETQVDVRAEHTSRSYPSGHSMSTTTVWGLAAGYAQRARRGRLAAALCIPIACTFVASAIQGVHWPTDALAGTVMGAAAAWLALRALRDDKTAGDGLRPAR